MDENALKKADKINFALALFAILLGFASPFIGYYFLNPQIQAFRDRPRLQVTGIPETVTLKSGEPIDLVKTLTGRSYKVEIANSGPLPANNVLITLQYNDLSRAPNEPVIDPPVITEIVDKGATKFITLKQPIAPQDKLTVTLAAPPETILVTSEFGERNIINTESQIARWIKSADIKKIEIYAGDTLIQTIDKQEQTRPTPGGSNANQSNTNK